MQPASEMALNFAGFAVTWDSFTVSTKYFAKALAPSAVWARAAAGTFTVVEDDDGEVLALDAALVLVGGVLLDERVDVAAGSASAPSLQLVTVSAAARLAVTMAALAYPVKTLPISTLGGVARRGTSAPSVEVCRIWTISLVHRPRAHGDDGATRTNDADGAGSRSGPGVSGRVTVQRGPARWTGPFCVPLCGVPTGKSASRPASTPAPLPDPNDLVTRPR